MKVQLCDSASHQNKLAYNKPPWPTLPCMWPYFVPPIAWEATSVPNGLDPIFSPCNSVHWNEGTEPRMHLTVTQKTRPCRAWSGEASLDTSGKRSLWLPDYTSARALLSTGSCLRDQFNKPSVPSGKASGGTLNILLPTLISSHLYSAAGIEFFLHKLSKICVGLKASRHML